MKVMLSHFLSSSSTSIFLSLSTKLHLRITTKRALSSCIFTSTTMSVNLHSHAFAGNPLRSKTPKAGDPLSPTQALETLKSRILEATHFPSSPSFKVLPFRKGRPLASSPDGTTDSSSPIWHLGWLALADFKDLLAKSGTEINGDSLVYLGSQADEDIVYWAIDVSEEAKLVPELGSLRFSFVELRTLMVATDWADANAMGQLAVAGHARALLEWHSTSNFCGRCGEKTVPKEAGRRKQCSSDLCKQRIYPRVDPPGESLEEAVKRETWEETGIEVGKVVYHSSQPWPVGPSSIPCQLMVGFFAHAKSFEINVDKEELEDATWHNREDVKKALLAAEYKKAQKTAAVKVEQMCKGVEKTQSFSGDFNVESGELAPMFFPGPFAIAHHLISAWAFQDETADVGQSHLKQRSGSFSNL
ncbi:nudix hydrolase 19, chloroplastic isoform X2 [Humulus lupulus]|uniref:nudix hydrolase 19, chloroplastic isoform X2 n=1 Tax=Humulus lupulus TaxID=3486 RepID=UPI002B40A2B7|nr:nudix hydrolase 19, chloroplastic isoform X2 [Humulus lupulus]